MQTQNPPSTSAAPPAATTVPPIPLPTGETAPAGASGGDATGGLIPYRNSSALLSYYIGLFSLLPCIGLFMGIAAVALGIKGLRAAKEYPAVKGKAHAWVGIVCGAFWAAVYGLVFGGMGLALIFSNR